MQIMLLVIYKLQKKTIFQIQIDCLCQIYVNIIAWSRV